MECPGRKYDIKLVGEANLVFLSVVTCYKSDAVVALPLKD